MICSCEVQRLSAKMELAGEKKESLASLACWSVEDRIGRSGSKASPLLQKQNKIGVLFSSHARLSNSFQYHLHQ